jgi:predicted membrane protein
MVLLEIDNLAVLVYTILFIMFAPPIILLIIGLSIRKRNRKSSNVLMIIALLYLTIGLGYCGLLMSGSL